MKINRLAAALLTHLTALIALALLSSNATLAQSTAFTYQGRLNDNGAPANGTYDFQIKLFDALTAGNQVGVTNSLTNVVVSSGGFSVMLDFGAAAFPGANRWLEINVRLAGGGGFTTLSPRQPITSTPYSIRSLSAASAEAATTATNAATASNATSADTLSAACNGCVNGTKLADGSVNNAKITDVAGSKITGIITTGTLPGANVTGAVANATNAVTATNATNATTAVNFSGALAGDVAGNQGTTSVVKLRNLPLPTPVQADDGKVLRYKNDGVNPASFELATVNSSGGTLTGVTAGTGLSGGGTSGNVTVGIAASGVTTTELAANAVTTAKLTDNSVTDAKISAVAGSKITGTIPVAGVPAGSASYIQNTTTQQASSNFNISGNGTLGGTLAASNVGIGTPTPGTPLDLAGAFSVRGTAAPPVAPTGQGRLYFDAALNKFRISQNGGAYSDLFGSGSGVTGNGTTGIIPLWNGNTILGNSAITQSSSEVFIDLPVSPNSIFGLRNTIGRASMVVRSTVGSGELFLDRGSALSSNSSQVGFYTAGNADFSLGTSLGSAGNSDFSIYNYGTGSNALTIPKSSGNVGIGTTSPINTLHVNGGIAWGGGSSASYAYSDRDASGLFVEQVGTAAANSKIRFQSSRDGNRSSYSQFFVDPEKGFSFMAGGSANGKVGIGTTAPEGRLHIANATGNGTGLWVVASEGDRAAVHYSGDVGVVIDSVRPSDQRRLPVLLQPNGGNVGIGTPSPQAKLDVAGTVRTRVLQIWNGADLSEQFEVNPPLNATSRRELEKIQPGMVVSIDATNPGKLVISHQAYDRKVAGIISGAGGVQPGLLMGQTGSIANGDQPVALTGRVYCWADATNRPIQPGDLLTTSHSAGHAMKVIDHKKAQGAILGKAMTGLKTGRGLVLVLVTLQ